MKKTKRFLAMLLTLILCVGEISSTGLKVFAAGDNANDDTIIDNKTADEDAEEVSTDGVTYYNVWVGNTHVNSENKDDIPGVAGTIGEAKASYDPDTQTLTLLNVSIIEELQHSYGSLIFAEHDLTINAIQDVEGKFIISSYSKENWGIRVDNGSLTLKGNVNIQSEYHPIAVDKNLIIDGKVQAGCKGHSSQAINVGETMEVKSGGDVYARGDVGVAAKKLIIGYGSAFVAMGDVDSAVDLFGLENKGDEDNFLYMEDGMYIYAPTNGKLKINAPERGGSYYAYIADKDGEKAKYVDIRPIRFYLKYIGYDDSIAGYSEGFAYGETITKPKEDPVKNGYVFGGYYTDYKHTVPYKFGNVVKEPGEIYIYTKWTKAYDLWVGGIQVTEDNMSSIPCDSGTASYDPSTNTLTFKDAKISNGYEYNTSSKRTAGVYAKGSNLTIKGDLTVDGTAIKDAICVEDTAANGNKLILDGNITVKGEYGISTRYTGVEINGGTLDIDATTTAIKAGAPILLGTGMKVLSPEGAEFKKSAYGDVYYLFETADSNVQVKTATIGSGVTETCTVTFDLNGKEGATPIPQIVEKGKTASKPSDPSVEDFVFVAWCTDKAGEKVYDFATPVTVDITLYAKWVGVTVETCTVTFDLNGKEGTAPSPQKVEKGKTATKPADPKTDGFTFKLWCTDKEGKKNYDFSMAVNADITLYAKWEKAEEPGPTPDPLEGGRSALDPVPELIPGETAELYLVKGQKFNIGQGWYIDKADKDSKKKVSISKKGAFKAKAEGEAVIKCGSGAAAWEVKLHISKPKMEKKSLKIQLETATDVKQEQIAFNYDKTNLNVLWYSSNPDVVTVDDTGKVTTVGKGSSKVTAYINGSAYTCTVSVKEKEGLQKRTLHVAKDASKTISIKGLKKPEWKTSEEGIVEIKKNKVTGIKAGTADLSFTQGDITYTVTVIVEDLGMSGTGLKPGKTNKYTIDELKIGDTAKLSFAGVEQDTVFKSSKPDVAFIDENGHIVARSKGTSKLTTKINGKTITITVKVTE